MAGDLDALREDDDLAPHLALLSRIAVAHQVLYLLFFFCKKKRTRSDDDFASHVARKESDFTTSFTTSLTTASLASGAVSEDVVDEGIGFGRRACSDEQCHRPILADAREYDRLLAAFLARHACIRQHTSAYVSIRQHTSAYVSGCPRI